MLRVEYSICALNEEAEEWVDMVSALGLGVVGVEYRVQIMLSAVSDCKRVSSLYGP